jgi:hypothetical protein
MVEIPMPSPTNRMTFLAAFGARASARIFTAAAPFTK